MSLGAKQRGAGDPAVGERQLAMVVATMRDRWCAAADRESRGAVVDKESRYRRALAPRSFLGAGHGEQHHIVGDIGMADEMFGAVDDPVAANPPGPGRHRTDVCSRHRAPSSPGSRGARRGPSAGDRSPPGRPRRPAGCYWAGKPEPAAPTTSTRARARPASPPWHRGRRRPARLGSSQRTGRPRGPCRGSLAPAHRAPRRAVRPGPRAVPAHGGQSRASWQPRHAVPR